MNYPQLELPSLHSSLHCFAFLNFTIFCFVFHFHTRFPLTFLNSAKYIRHFHYMVSVKKLTTSKNWNFTFSFEYWKILPSHLLSLLKIFAPRKILVFCFPFFLISLCHFHFCLNSKCFSCKKNCAEIFPLFLLVVVVFISCNVLIKMSVCFVLYFSTKFHFLIPKMKS